MTSPALNKLGMSNRPNSSQANTVWMQSNGNEPSMTLSSPHMIAQHLVTGFRSMSGLYIHLCSCWGCVYVWDVCVLGMCVCVCVGDRQEVCPLENILSDASPRGFSTGILGLAPLGKNSGYNKMIYTYLKRDYRTIENKE